MHYRQRHLLSSLSLAYCLLSGSALSSELQSFDHKDSLRAQSPLGCVPVDEIVSTSSAADIAAGALRCLKSRKYAMAAELVMAASAFSHFDAQRVADGSARVAHQALYTQTFARQSQSRMEALFAEMNKLTPGSERHREICTWLRTLPPPDYLPTYMIAHGLAAFRENPEPPLLAEFKAEAAWQDSVGTHLNCAEYGGSE